MDNGTVGWPDTSIRIRDNISGDTLLGGYLPELAYMPSNLDGFAGSVLCRRQMEEAC